MDHHTLIPKERGRRRVSTEILVRVLRDESSRSDIAVLAREVANLAGGWRGDVAGIVLAAVGWVEVAHGGGAVAVRWDGCGVDVVDERAVGAFGGEAGEVYGYVHAAGAGAGGDEDGAGDG